MKYAVIYPERFDTRDEAQAEADRLNAEADEECGYEVWGDGAASVVEVDERTEDAWWAWHDADSSRWSPGECDVAATADAEARCAAWVAGESDDGPA